MELVTLEDNLAGCCGSGRRRTRGGCGCGGGNQNKNVNNIIIGGMPPMQQQAPPPSPVRYVRQYVPQIIRQVVPVPIYPPGRQGYPSSHARPTMPRRAAVPVVTIKRQRRVVPWQGAARQQPQQSPVVPWQGAARQPQQSPVTQWATPIPPTQSPVVSW